jgi:hypothetical protein
LSKTAGACCSPAPQISFTGCKLPVGELALEAAIAKLDKFHLLILDDLAYVTKDQAETSVLFELIRARYERRSLLITANQPFGEWGVLAHTTIRKLTPSVSSDFLDSHV